MQNVQNVNPNRTSALQRVQSNFRNYGTPLDEKFDMIMELCAAGEKFTHENLILQTIHLGLSIIV